MPRRGQAPRGPAAYALKAAQAKTSNRLSVRELGRASGWAGTRRVGIRRAGLPGAGPLLLRGRPARRCPSRPSGGADRPGAGRRAAFVSSRSACSLAARAWLSVRSALPQPSWQANWLGAVAPGSGSQRAASRLKAQRRNASGLSKRTSPSRARNLAAAFGVVRAPSKRASRLLRRVPVERRSRRSSPRRRWHRAVAPLSAWRRARLGGGRHFAGVRGDACSCGGEDVRTQEADLAVGGGLVVEETVASRVVV